MTNDYLQLAVEASQNYGPQIILDLDINGMPTEFMSLTRPYI